MEFFKRFDDKFLFSSEKLLESWLEENIHHIFPELEIIDRPYATWIEGAGSWTEQIVFHFLLTSHLEIGDKINC